MREYNAESPKQGSERFNSIAKTKCIADLVLIYLWILGRVVVKNHICVDRTFIGTRGSICNVHLNFMVQILIYFYLYTCIFVYLTVNLYLYTCIFVHYTTMQCTVWNVHLNFIVQINIYFYLYTCIFVYLYICILVFVYLYLYTCIFVHYPTMYLYHPSPPSILHPFCVCALASPWWTVLH